LIVVVTVCPGLVKMRVEGLRDIKFKASPNDAPVGADNTVITGVMESAWPGTTFAGAVMARDLLVTMGISPPTNVNGG
jgi:hypothetical protein